MRRPVVIAAVALLGCGSPSSSSSGGEGSYAAAPRPAVLFFTTTGGVRYSSPDAFTVQAIPATSTHADLITFDVALTRDDGATFLALEGRLDAATLASGAATLTTAPTTDPNAPGFVRVGENDATHTGGSGGAPPGDWRTGTLTMTFGDGTIEATFDGTDPSTSGKVTGKFQVWCSKPVEASEPGSGGGGTTSPGEGAFTVDETFSTPFCAPFAKYAPR